MIEENIKIHDKFKFEIKFNYPIKEKKTKYEINSYLFFPKTLAIGDNFNYDRFYNSIQSYIRFKTPTILLKDITSHDSNYSPIKLLKINFEKITKEFSQKNINKFENSIKLYGAISKSSFREHVDFIKKKNNVKDIEFIVEEYIIHSKKILIEYRNLRNIITVPTIKSDIFSIYRYGDEYLSLLFNKYTYKILEEIKNHKNLINKYKTPLLALIKNEINYRENNNLRIIMKENSDNSLYLYRASNLKKYISSLLYLNTRTNKADTIITQVVFSFAAGLSMIFATLVAFYAQKSYGSLTLPLFVALVISYIFKDRIKDLVKLYFNKKFRKKVFDYKTIIKHNNNKIGIVQERAELIDFKYLDEKIKKIRIPKLFNLIQNGVDGEDIIFYKKKLKILNSAMDEELNGIKVDGINDIIRFDISDYLKNMDNPSKKIFFYKDNDYKEIKAKRIYHINLIMLYKDSKKNKTYKKFRIILNRKGIVDIINLDDDGTNI